MHATLTVCTNNFFTECTQIETNFMPFLTIILTTLRLPFLPQTHILLTQITLMGPPRHSDNRKCICYFYTHIFCIINPQGCVLPFLHELQDNLHESLTLFS